MCSLPISKAVLASWPDFIELFQAVEDLAALVTLATAQAREVETGLAAVRQGAEAGRRWAGAADPRGRQGARGILRVYPPAQRAHLESRIH